MYCLSKLRFSVTFTHMMEFGIERVAVTDGGHINGTFLGAGLIYEAMLMIGSGIGGRKGMTAVFDCIDYAHRHATMLHLKSVEKMN